MEFSHATFGSFSQRQSHNRHPLLIKLLGKTILKLYQTHNKGSGNTAHAQVPLNDDWEPTTLLEVTNMIKSLPNDSSPGYDQITNEILKPFE